MAQLRSTQPSPRWLYSFLGWVQRTPLGGVPLIILFFVAGTLVAHIPLWQAGILPQFQFNSDVMFSASWFPANVLVWLLMDRLALGALQDFGTGLGKSSSEIKHTYNNFISIGEIAALALVVLAAAFGYIDAATKAAALGITQMPGVLLVSLPSVLGGIFEGLAVIRITKQLITVNNLYKQVKDINLFNLWPIYALSRYGYTLALVFVVSAALIDVFLILVTGSGNGMGSLIYTLAFSLVLFITPVLGINTRLRREKERELQRLGIQLNKVYSETEAAVRGRKLAKVTPLRAAAGALKEQMDAVQKVATWPWNPGSLRNLFLPILLPLFIAILQRYVLTFLGF